MAAGIREGVVGELTQGLVDVGEHLSHDLLVGSEEEEVPPETIIVRYGEHDGCRDPGDL